MAAYAVLTTVTDQPGILFGLTKVLADHHANVTYVDIIPHADRASEIYFEFTFEGEPAALSTDLGAVPGVSAVELTLSFSRIYGKRIVIMGGGAQVGHDPAGRRRESRRSRSGRRAPAARQAVGAGRLDHGWRHRARR